MQNNTKQQDSNDQPTADIDNVDKIREILFGNQIKDFEHKFHQLQDQLNRELNNLKNDSKMRIESLEGFVKSELESLNQRLDNEQKIRIAELEESSDKLESRIKLLDSRLIEQEKQTNDKARELHQLLLEQAKEMFEKMDQKQMDNKEMLARVREELDNGKVDRSALSSLLTELAMQISGNDFSAELLTSERLLNK